MTHAYIFFSVGWCAAVPWMKCLCHHHYGTAFIINTSPLLCGRRVNEESEEEALLTRVQRAFKCIDTDECGFIMEDRLAEVRSVWMGGGLEFVSFS